MLRDKIFSSGCPCAVVTLEKLNSCPCAHVIITFADKFNDVRRMPVDDIFVIAIGIGFINSALNAVRVDNENEAIETAYAHILGKLGIENADKYVFGVLDEHKGVFFSEYFIEIWGRRVFFTSTEYMIFKYLIAFAGTEHKFSTDNIARLCLKKAERSQIESNKISVHIANINSKVKAKMGEPIIAVRRYLGHYAVVIE